MPVRRPLLHRTSCPPITHAPLTHKQECYESSQVLCHLCHLRWRYYTSKWTAVTMIKGEVRNNGWSDILALTLLSEGSLLATQKYRVRRHHAVHEAAQRMLADLALKVTCRIGISLVGPPGPPPCVIQSSCTQTLHELG
jgi:hypothetical protein